MENTSRREANSLKWNAHHFSGLHKKAPNNTYYRTRSNFKTRARFPRSAHRGKARLAPRKRAHASALAAHPFLKTTATRILGRVVSLLHVLIFKILYFRSANHCSCIWAFSKYRFPNPLIAIAGAFDQQMEKKKLLNNIKLQSRRFQQKIKHASTQINICYKH